MNSQTPLTLNSSKLEHDHMNEVKTWIERIPIGCVLRNAFNHQENAE